MLRWAYKRKQVLTLKDKLYWDDTVNTFCIKANQTYEKKDDYLKPEYLK